MLLLGSRTCAWRPVPPVSSSAPWAPCGTLVLRSHKRNRNLNFHRSGRRVGLTNYTVVTSALRSGAGSRDRVNDWPQAQPLASPVKLHPLRAGRSHVSHPPCRNVTARSRTHTCRPVTLSQRATLECDLSLDGSPQPASTVPRGTLAKPVRRFAQRFEHQGDFLDGRMDEV